MIKKLVERTRSLPSVAIEQVQVLDRVAIESHDVRELARERKSRLVFFSIRSSWLNRHYGHKLCSRKDVLQHTTPSEMTHRKADGS